MKTTSIHYLWVSLVLVTLAMLCPQSGCAAGATSTEINNTIVQEGSIPLTWENDATYPWSIINDKIQSGNAGSPNSSSTISLRFESQYPTQLDFNYSFPNGGYNDNYLKVYVDGVNILNEHYNEGAKSIRIPKGNHMVEFCDTILNASYYNRYSFIYNVKVAEFQGASIDEINSAIVAESSIPLIWQQDKDYPWQIVDGKLKSSNWGFNNSQSKVSFKYSSQYPTQLDFNYSFPNGGYNDNYLKVYVDGVNILNEHYNDGRKTYRVIPGEHIVEFCDTIYNTTAYNRYSFIYNVGVVEPQCATPHELNNKFCIGTSTTITWENDTIFPIGYINENLSTTNSMWENTKSSLKAHVNFEKPSVISFDWRVGYDDRNDNHIARFYVDGVLKYSNSRNTSWATNTVALSAGEHTLHWEYSSTTTGAKYWMQLKDLSISSDWISVESSPGMLGVETLYKVNKLQDVNFLKIKGGMNDADWKVVKQMVNLYGLDLSEAEITTFPASFNSNANFGYIVLPETLKQIPDKAFATCNIHSITIPSSVNEIGNEAFSNTSLGVVNFSPNSQIQNIGTKAFYNTSIGEIEIPSSLRTIGADAFYKSELVNLSFANDANLKTIGENAFRECRNLVEAVMPNTVTNVGKYAFADCSSLKKIHFSDAISILYEYTCANCNKVEDLHLPNNVTSIGRDFMYGANKVKDLLLPESLLTIGQDAFAGLHSAVHLVLPDKLQTIGKGAFHNSSRLKIVDLPSGVSSYNQTFLGCENIETIVCRAATPPVVIDDAFSAVDKANVTLKVPSFSIATYKLDSYWYQFGEIIEGEPTDYWKIIGDLKLLNNRRMEGKPDVDLYYGGKLTVKGDAAMPIGKFDIYTSEGNPSSFVTDCPNITADEINTIFSVSANKWHYLTPMVDVDLQNVIVSGTTNYVFRYYDGAARADIGAGTSWKNVSDMKLKAGVGYIFQCDAAGTLTFPVPVTLHKNILTTGAVTLPLTPHPSDNKANKGWNYVGNPFPSYFDIHYMDFTAPITVWDGSTYKAYSITDDNFVLRPMQGFFVQKPDAVDNIVLQAAGRQIESTVNRPNNVSPFARLSSEKERFIFNIEIAADTISDVTRIVLNENASTEYELERDASKFMSMNEAVPQIYSIDNDGNRLALNERPATDGGIALGVYIPDGNSNYSISANRIDGEAYLYDAEMRITHNFADGDYNFSAEQGINNNRFSIILKGKVPSSVDAIGDENSVEISTIENGIIICGASDKTIRVVTLEGINMYSTRQSEATINIPLPSGNYIVNVESQSYKVIVK